MCMLHPPPQDRAWRSLAARKSGWPGGGAFPVPDSATQPPQDRAARSQLAHRAARKSGWPGGGAFPVPVSEEEEEEEGAVLGSSEGSGGSSGEEDEAGELGDRWSPAHCMQPWYMP